MLAISIYFERRENCGRQYPVEKWRKLVDSFAVNHVFVIDRVDLPCFEPDFKSCTIVKDFNEIEWGGEYVFVDKDTPMNRTAIPYDTFRHPPEDVMYCFGGDSCGILQAHPKAETELPGDWIYIPTADDYGIWAEQAAAIVLADRYSRADT